MLKQATERIENDIKNQQKVESVPAPTLQSTHVPSVQVTQHIQTSGFQPTDDCEPESPGYTPDKPTLTVTDHLSQLSVSVSWCFVSD